MKKSLLLPLLSGLFAFQSQAQVPAASTARTEQVRCEAIRDDELTPGTTYRGVKIYVQTYVYHSRSNSIEPAAEASVRKAWFGADKDLRDAAGPKCWKAVHQYRCEVSEPYYQSASSEMEQVRVDIKRIDQETGNVDVIERGALSVNADSGYQRCLSTIVDLAYVAMSAESATAVANYNAAHEKERQSSLDKAAKGNANKL